MTKLSKSMRHQIIENAVNQSTITDEKKQLTKETQDFAREYSKSFIPELFNKTIKSLPKDWFPHTTYLNMPREFDPINLMDVNYKNYGYSSLQFEAFPRPCLFEVDEISENNLPRELKALIIRAEKIREKENLLRSGLFAAVNSFSTLEKLLLAMPELTDCIPAELTIKKSMPLAVDTSNLSALLRSVGVGT